MLSGCLLQQYTLGLACTTLSNTSLHSKSTETKREMLSLQHNYVVLTYARLSSRVMIPPRGARVVPNSERVTSSCANLI
jgi:hypothetical protein